MSRIIVELPLDRGFCGRLIAFDDLGKLLCGPFPVAARAGDARAQAEGNPSRNPMLRYGDTPTGNYRVTRIVRHEADAHERFGPNGVLVLEATGGDAALAEANGRYRLFIQGGSLAANGALRSTSGSLRLRNEDLATLARLVGEEKNVRVDVIAHADMTAGGAVIVDDRVRDDDPPELPGAPAALRDMFGEVSRREALRAGAGGAAGLTALSLSVSFISLGTPTPAHAYTRMAYNDEPTAGGGASSATGNVPNGDRTTVGPGDERTTGGSEGGTPITGDQGQPITGAGVQQGPADRQPPPNPISGGPAAQQGNNAAEESNKGANSSSPEDAAAHAGAPFDRGAPPPAVQESAPSSAKQQYFNAMNAASQISDPNARNAAINKANADYAKATGQPAPAQLPTNQ